MKNILAGFVMGLAFAGFIAWFFVIPQVRESYRDVGYNDGRISAKYEFADQIDTALGNDFQVAESQVVLYHVKSISVVVVDRNGVKTLRAIR